MTLRKEVKEMDKELHEAFKLVELEIALLGLMAKRLNKRVISLEKDKKRFTKVGPVTGKTYTTLNGRVHAIAQHLGIKFDVTPKEVVKNPAKVSAVKVVAKKGKK